MPDKFTYHLDYSKPTAKRMIELPPQEPEPDVETPDDEELWVKLELETKPSLKWRGHVGTFIADQLGYDVSHQPYHLKDWPAGYSLWLKRRPGGGTRHDIYLLGFGGKKRFSSPQEFAFHAFWLYIPDYHKTRPCPCILHNPGQTQGQINEKWLAIPRRKYNTERRAPEFQDDDDEEQVVPPEDIVYGFKSRFFHYQASRKRILENLKAPVDEQREKDLNSPAHFRKGELVWVSIPPLKPARQSRPEEFIGFWPGIIEARDSKYRPGPGGVRIRYDVKLLVANTRHTVNEGSIVSWHAYKLPRIVLNAMTRATPPADLTKGLSELSRFQPLPASDEDDTLDRTYQNALCPLLLARYIAFNLARYYFLDVPYTDTSTEPAKVKHQGLWWGPELIWLDEIVRISASREELETQYNVTDILPQRPPPEGSSAPPYGIFGRLSELYIAIGQPMFTCTLYEMERLSDEDMDFEYTQSTVSSEADPEDRAFALPSPLPGHRWRCISKDDEIVCLPLQVLAGRYDPLPFRSAEHQELLSHIINEETVNNFHEGVSSGRSLDMAVNRIMSVSGLVLSGRSTAAATSKWAARPEAIKLSDKEERAQFSEKWVTGR